jgi:hypothetical protein
MMVMRTTIATAMHHLVGDFSTTGRVICGGDQDWFSINLPVGGVLDVLATFTNADGDIDIAIWYPFEDSMWVNRVASSESKVNDFESLSYTVPAGAAGKYYIQIKGYLLDRNTYGLTVTKTGTCDTCASLGVECGSWDDGCGDTLTCGPCGVGVECDEYFGICAETLCDLIPGCCDGNTLRWCEGGDEYSDTCGVGATCTWSDADFWFACYFTPGTPPAGMIEECPDFP